MLECLVYTEHKAALALLAKAIVQTDIDTIAKLKTITDAIVRHPILERLAVVVHTAAANPCY